MTSSSPAELLQDKREAVQRAIRLLETYGWCQSQFGDKKMGFCLIGSFREACFNQPYWVYDGIIRDLMWVLDAHGELEIATWNDQPDRTKEQVFAILQRLQEEEN